VHVLPRLRVGYEPAPDCGACKLLTH
jgi:hypothetical protein